MNFDISTCVFSEHGKNCCTACDCYVWKCPEAIRRMTEEEKKFYNVREKNTSYYEGGDVYEQN